MANKRRDQEIDTYILPSTKDEMRKFIDKFKLDMFDHIVSAIQHAIKNRATTIEVFQFKDSPYVITLNRKEFDINLAHIHKIYKEKEIYELCAKVEDLRTTLNKDSNK